MIANRLKALRKSKKMTQDELAAALGTSKQTIHRYENGIITNIPPEKVEKLAAALGTTPSELMGWGQTALPEGAMPISTKRLPVLGEIAWEDEAACCLDFSRAECVALVHVDEAGAFLGAGERRVRRDVGVRREHDALLDEALLDRTGVAVGVEEAVGDDERFLFIQYAAQLVESDA